MIDSSEHIREPPKMVGFDLVARIRELEAENVQLLAALDESERVVAHKTKSAAHWYDEHLQARADRVQCKRVVEQQAARIEELEDAAKPRAGLYGKYHLSKADGSPVDPGADYFVLRLDSDPVARRAALQYSYMTPDRTLAIGLQEKLTKYNPKMEDCINLQFFGMERPRVWQITEERILAIENAISSCVLIERYTGQDLQHETAVLRGMLDEVA